MFEIFCRIECVMMNLTNVVPMFMKLTVRWEKQACVNIQTDKVIIMFYESFYKR